MSTFEIWLKSQKNRNDSIGDVANDYISELKKTGIKCLNKQLDNCNPCSEALIAIKQARKEYSKYNGKEIDKDDKEDIDNGIENEIFYNAFDKKYKFQESSIIECAEINKYFKKKGSYNDLTKTILLHHYNIKVVKYYGVYYYINISEIKQNKLKEEARLTKLEKRKKREEEQEKKRKEKLDKYIDVSKIIKEFNNKYKYENDKSKRIKRSTVNMVFKDCGSDPNSTIKILKTRFNIDTVKINGIYYYTNISEKIE